MTEVAELRLLLQPCDDEHAEAPLSLEDAAAAPRPGRSEAGKVDADGAAQLKAGRKYWAAFGDDPNDLAKQRWGVIAARGSHGDELLQLVDPLVKLRQAEQNAPVITFRVAAQQSFVEALRWKEDVYQAQSLDEDDRPRYLLVLGDVNEVSLELQHVLAHVAFVGRLCCATADGYRAYVVKAAKAPTPPVQPGVTLFSADDGTFATATARAQLIEPAQQRIAEKWAKTPRLEAARSRVLAGTMMDELLEVAASANVLLSVTHGFGGPASGWTEQEQRARQGALSLNGDLLTGVDVQDKPFVAGGAWFCLACFGAGCPKKSLFAPWLKSLTEQGVSKAQRLIQRLGVAREPFVAALPQALLGSETGPLSIISHVDLAWTYAFSRADQGAGAMQRVLSVIESWTRGHRAGVAFDHLMRAYRDETERIVADYHDEDSARIEGVAYEVDRRLRGYRWIARNDLMAYILLGDPAACVS